MRVVINILKFLQRIKKVSSRKPRYLQSKQNGMTGNLRSRLVQGRDARVRKYTVWCLRRMVARIEATTDLIDGVGDTTGFFEEECFTF